MLKLELQRFADSGSGGNLVATTQNFVNAYTGATTAFDPANTMQPQIKEWYNTEALENARNNHIFAQFAKNVPLPENHGMTVEMRKPNTFPDVERLTEGVIPDGQKFGYSALTMNVYEYGAYAALGRRLATHAIDPVAQDMTEEMGAAGGNTLDKLARNVAISGSNVLYCPDSSNNEKSARIALDATCKLTPTMVNRARTWLKKHKAPTINGDYVAIIHPSVAYDLRQSAEWLDAHKYAQPDEIYNGEIGKLHGVRFVESDNAKVYCGEDLCAASRTLTVSANVTGSTSVSVTQTLVEDALIGRYVIIGTTKYKITDNNTSGITIDTAATIAKDAVIYPGEGGAGGIAVYGCVFLGKDAFAMVDVAGGSMEMIIKSKEEAGGPLNQFGTIGVYFETGGGVLYEDRLLRVECGGFYSDVDEGT